MIAMTTRSSMSVKAGRARVRQHSGARGREGDVGAGRIMVWELVRLPGADKTCVDLGAAVVEAAEVGGVQR